MEKPGFDPDKEPKPILPEDSGGWGGDGVDESSPIPAQDSGGWGNNSDFKEPGEIEIGPWGGDGVVGPEPEDDRGRELRHDQEYPTDRRERGEKGN